METDNILQDVGNMLSIFGYSYKKRECRERFCFSVDGVIEENRYIRSILALCGGYMSEIEFVVCDLKESTNIYINKVNDGLNPDSDKYLKLLVGINKVSDSNTNELFLHLHDRGEFKRVVDENHLLSKYYSPFF